MSRLALGLAFLILGLAMTLYKGAVYTVLRWVFFIAAAANCGMILFLYQRQKQEKIHASKETASKPSETNDLKE